MIKNNEFHNNFFFFAEHLVEYVKPISTMQVGQACKADTAS